MRVEYYPMRARGVDTVAVMMTRARLVTVCGVRGNVTSVTRLIREAHGHQGVTSDHT